MTIQYSDIGTPKATQWSLDNPLQPSVGGLQSNLQPNRPVAPTYRSYTVGNSPLVASKGMRILDQVPQGPPQMAGNALAPPLQKNSFSDVEGTAGSENWKRFTNKVPVLPQPTVATKTDKTQLKQAQAQGFSNGISHVNDETGAIVGNWY